MICPFPRQSDSWVFGDPYRRGAVALTFALQEHAYE